MDLSHQTMIHRGRPLGLSRVMSPLPMSCQEADRTWYGSNFDRVRGLSAPRQTDQVVATEPCCGVLHSAFVIFLLDWCTIRHEAGRVQTRSNLHLTVRD